MKIEITKTEKEVINITLPLFVKYNENTIAVLTENKAIKVTILAGLTMVTTCSPNVLYEFDKLHTYPVITQGQFNDDFNEAMSLIINYNLPTLSTNEVSTIQI